MKTQRFGKPAIMMLVVLGSPLAQAGQHWGDFRAEQCTKIGSRQYSSVLWDIPWGQNWEAACARMPADINGMHFDKPTRCVTNTNEWGQFDVPDTSCPHWGTFKRDTCTLPGKRQYSAVLQEIPVGESWETACAKTGATVQGQAFARPSRCSNQLTAMWGEFDVDDASCAAPASVAHAVSSLCPPGLVCVYRAPRYLNVYWAGAGDWDRNVATTDPLATRGRIDTFVRDLTAGGYFSGLAQYGVGQPAFAGSVEANPKCLQQFPVSQSADFARISGFVACQVNSLQLPSTDGLIVNLFLLPQVAPLWVNATVLGQTVHWVGCDSYGGYHAIVPLTLIGRGGAVAPTVPFTVLPLQCDGVGRSAPLDRYNALTAVTSHEMVEAATNPGGFGWKDMIPNDMVTAKNPLLEAADMCQPGSTLFPTQPRAYSNGNIDAYWSNNPPGCVFGQLRAVNSSPVRLPPPMAPPR